MIALISVFPLLITTIYLTIVSVKYCLNERASSGDIKIYDKLVLTTASTVLLQVAVLMGGVVFVGDLENWKFNVALAFVQCLFGSGSRCIVQLNLWLQMRCIFRGRDGSMKNISYVIGNIAAVTSIVSSILSLAGHSAAEVLKKRLLGWRLPCRDFIIIKLILTLTNIADLTTKMTLISLVLYEVLRQKRANLQNGFGFRDLQSVARRMVICMLFALINDLVLLGIALMPVTDNEKLRSELMPTVSCINSLGNLVILIISFPTWKKRLLPFKPPGRCKKTATERIRMRTVNIIEESKQQTEMTSDFHA